MNPPSTAQTAQQGERLTRRKALFSSESVTEGHPDKVCDQISDAILDAVLAQDPDARVACETFATTGNIIVSGEMTTDCYVDIPKTVRSTIEEIGYTRAAYGLDAETCGVMTSIDEQSPDIAQGVDTGGAGDQGLMFGYAVAETPTLMPMPIDLAHRLAKQLAAVRKDGTLGYLRPDGKSQATLRYEEGQPAALEAVVLAAQHDPGVDQDQLKADLIEHVVKPVVHRTEQHLGIEGLLDEDCTYYINHTGTFELGGPHADTGLTGRKVIVDTYGGSAPHGGGAFSGKDPTKVDRSANYATRWIAKNVVAAGLAHACSVQLAYSIGAPEPVSFLVDTHGTGVVEDERIEQIIQKTWDLTPNGLIDAMDLLRPIYRPHAAYGHLGRDDLESPWEQLTHVEELQAAVDGQAELAPPNFEVR